jgi:hypothetical protein
MQFGIFVKTFQHVICHEILNGEEVGSQGDLKITVWRSDHPPLPDPPSLKGLESFVMISLVRWNVLDSCKSSMLPFDQSVSNFVEFDPRCLLVCVGSNPLNAKRKIENLHANLRKFGVET